MICFKSAKDILSFIQTRQNCSSIFFAYVIAFGWHKLYDLVNSQCRRQTNSQRLQISRLCRACNPLKHFNIYDGNESERGDATLKYDTVRNIVIKCDCEIALEPARLSSIIRFRRHTDKQFRQCKKAAVIARTLIAVRTMVLARSIMLNNPYKAYALESSIYVYRAVYFYVARNG